MSETFGPFEVAEPRLKGRDHAARVVDAERRLGDVGDGRIVRQLEAGDVLDRRNEVNGSADLSLGPLHLGMPGMADQDQRRGRAPRSACPGDGPSTPADRWRPAPAGRAPRLVDDRLGHAMGAEDRDGAVRDLVQLLDEAQRPCARGARRHGGCARSRAAHRPVPRTSRASARRSRSRGPRRHRNHAAEPR